MFENWQSTIESYLSYFGDHPLAKALIIILGFLDSWILGFGLDTGSGHYRFYP